MAESRPRVRPGSRDLGERILPVGGLCRAKPEISGLPGRVEAGVRGTDLPFGAAQRGITLLVGPRRVSASELYAHCTSGAANEDRLDDNPFSRTWRADASVSSYEINQASSEVR